MKKKITSSQKTATEICCDAEEKHQIALFIFTFQKNPILYIQYFPPILNLPPWNLLLFSNSLDF